MARKSRVAKVKSKSKSKVEKAKSKKSKQKKPGRKKRVRAADTVYVVSSIEVRGGLETAFENGLKRIQPGMEANFDNENLGYDSATLEAAITRLNNEPRAALIATVGGLITFKAADKFATKPFICLVGSRPDSTSSMFRGGVTLQSFRMNTLRLEYLEEEKGFAKNEVGLLYNPKSVMAGQEVDRWKGGCTVKGAGGRNDANTYPADFQSFPSTIKAIVISADPFFFKSRNKLVKAANDDGRYIVYPLQNYGNTTPRPAPNRATLYGPTLRAPYRLLGQSAGIVLQTNAALDPLFSLVEDEITPVT